jgi:hypothetical protein
MMFIILHIGKKILFIKAKRVITEVDKTRIKGSVT